jgi:lysosomal acid lipase/cholesteryl ester hydrolase
VHPFKFVRVRSGFLYFFLMALPTRLVSSFGNFLYTLGELLGAVSGDKNLIIKHPSTEPSSSGTTTHVIDVEPSRIGPNADENLCCNSEDENQNLQLPSHESENTYKNPDIHLTVPELIQKYGYPFESHRVITKDKYILSLFRIPHGRNGKVEGDERPRPPVLLVHGLLNSAGAWIMHEPDKALAYILADSGYDCWLLNCRGCTYSRDHEEYSVADKEFWDFSFHEMGVYDIPAVIHHILTLTGYQQLSYIGHSLGSTKLMIAINEDEQIVNKIKMFICLAPAVYLYETTARLLSLNAPFYKQQKMFLDYFTGCGELMSKTFVQQVKPISRFFPSAEYLPAKCVTASMYTMGGHNPDQIHWPRLPVIAGHTPSSSSVRTYIHCVQYFINSEFQQYDYGSKELNMEAYGQPFPPKYDLRKTTCPTAIFYGENDLLCRPKTVEQLANELPNVLGCHKVECDKFSHTDFLYAKDVDKLVYHKILQMLNNSGT